MVTSAPPGHVQVVLAGPYAEFLVSDQPHLDLVKLVVFILRGFEAEPVIGAGVRHGLLEGPVS